MTPDNFRIRFVFDPDAQFEECNGESRPLTETEYADAEYMKDGKPIVYSKYLQYYGNPDRHYYLGCIVEKQCPCCSVWSTAESLWHIDLMDDDASLRDLTIGDLDRRHRANPREYLTPATARALPSYLGDVARELLQEAGCPA